MVAQLVDVDGWCAEVDTQGTQVAYLVHHDSDVQQDLPWDGVGQRDQTETPNSVSESLTYDALM